MIYSQEFCPCRRLGAYSYIDTISDSTTSSTTEDPSPETTTALETTTETTVYPAAVTDYSETLTAIYLALCAVLVALGVLIGSMFMNTLFKRWF